MFAFHYLISQKIEEVNITLKNSYLFAFTQNFQVFVLLCRVQIIPYGEYSTCVKMELWKKQVIIKSPTKLKMTPLCPTPTLPGSCSQHPLPL